MASSSSFLDDLLFRIDRNSLPVRTEQLRSRLSLYPTMLLSQILVEPTFVWLMWDLPEIQHKHLLLWLGLAYSLHLIEILLWLVHRNKLDTMEQCRNWSRRFSLFSLSIGLLWGLGALFFFPQNILFQILMICVMLGLAAGATATNATHPPALYAYVLALMLPLIFRVTIEQDTTHFALGSLLVLFLLVILVSGHFLNKLVLQSLRQRFENQSLAEQLAAVNNELEQKVEERTAQLRHKTNEVSDIRDVTIIAMGTLAETRDNETGNHLKRTQGYMRALALELRERPGFRQQLSEEHVEALHKLAPLHDIGKVGIPDHILLKPGKLTEEEFEIMKKHTSLGGDVLAAAENNLPAPSRFLHIAREIATGHHEKWDGSGYPSGLKGEAIPLSARLMAVADVYDALISERVYKKAFSHEEAVDIIAKGGGAHFDPDIIDAFLAIEEEFSLIANRYRDVIGAPHTQSA